MSNRFTAIPESTFDNLITGAGILLKTFNPNKGSFAYADIICATSGGISITCKPNCIDLADGAENIRPNLADFNLVDSWDASMSFTALDASVDGLKMALGAADFDGDFAVKPGFGYAKSYVRDLWWVGARGDDGIVAAYMKNALSEDGLSIQTEDKAKGKSRITLTSQQIMGNKDFPMVFYSVDPQDAELSLEDEITGDMYSVRIENGNMVYADDSEGPAKRHYRLVDSETGEIYRVKVSSGNLYYQKEE